MRKTTRTTLGSVLFILGTAAVVAGYYFMAQDIIALNLPPYIIIAVGNALILVAFLRSIRAQRSDHQQEIDRVRNETDAEFLIRNPQYKHFEIVSKLSNNLIQGRYYEQRGGFPPDLGHRWERDVGLLLSKLDPEYPGLFQQHPTLEARLRDLESILSHLIPPAESY